MDLEMFFPPVLQYSNTPLLHVGQLYCDGITYQVQK
jgi:hypothetical protein